MIIDASVYVGHWPFRRLRHNTVEGLISLMERNGIDKAVVSSINTVFYKNCQEGNEELAEEIEPYRDRLIPFATLNPKYVAWREDLERCVNDLGMKGLRLYPIYHNYGLLEPESSELLREAAEKMLPIELPVTLVDPRQHHWLDIDKGLDINQILEAADRYPENVFIILNAKSVALILEGSRRDATPGNVYVEMSRLSAVLNRSIQAVISRLGAERVVFGTGMPFHYAKPALLKMEILDLEKEKKEAIYWKNMSRLLCLFGD
jgi:hypothetical protein